MYDFDRHHRFFNGILRLTREEQEDPAGVITQFYQTYPIAEVRKDLTDLTLTFITGDDDDTDTHDHPFRRANILNFQKDLERLIEAVYLQSGLRPKAA